MTLFPNDDKLAWNTMGIYEEIFIFRFERGSATHPLPDGGRYRYNPILELYIQLLVYTIANTMELLWDLRAFNNYKIYISHSFRLGKNFDF